MREFEFATVASARLAAARVSPPADRRVFGRRVRNRVLAATLAYQPVVGDSGEVVLRVAEADAAAVRAAGQHRVERPVAERPVTVLP